MITKENKDKAIAKVARNKADVGSPEVQVSILTERIKEVTEHVKNNKHDFMAKRGLMQMVGKRKRLLRYLEETDFELYKKTVKKPDSIVIAINPSNGRNRPLNEFLKTAKEALEGFEDYPGIIREYTEILEKYISSEKGLKTYVKLAKEVETASSSAKAEKIKACNDSIKKFVTGEGLKMPSFKKPTVRKEPKTKKNDKKPAN